ncbi:uncharacterized protein RSE6_00419 [Rhynchosporium secalis]|uniref:Uncharacterized protein n=1 Tax=Rhynchosporium secalis TaxID=38038 RepID=A0A1E1LV72_RHYSE|nr:uncharacterized protein RSE6_00419 [Rhynchosporium secalis]
MAQEVNAVVDIHDVYAHSIGDISSMSIQLLILPEGHAASINSLPCHVSTNITSTHEDLTFETLLSPAKSQPYAKKARSPPLHPTD